MIIELLPNTTSSFGISYIITNDLVGVSLFVTAGLSLWTATLIAYRIQSVSKGFQNATQHRFYHIIQIVIQSAFIYSLVLIIEALLVMSTNWKLNANPEILATYYSDTILCAIRVCCF